ncbi:MAG: DUF86 domain-containing protein [Nitrospinota bacterium]|nr:DUF86 domain-containing protein [Nitrospinota bacterium]
MPHDPEKYIYDALQAARLIARFIEGKSYEDYSSDTLLRSGVERQLIIIGEALNRLSKLAPGMVADIQGHSKIIGFRNIAVHGYDIIENETVWGIVKSHLPQLHEQLETMLNDLDKSQ